MCDLFGTDFNFSVIFTELGFYGIVPKCNGINYSIEVLLNSCTIIL